MEQFKVESIQLVVNEVASELSCTMLEAVSKMQATAAKQGKDAMLEELIEFKNMLIDIEERV